MILALALVAASASVDPAAMVEITRETIGVAAQVRCPKAAGDEIVVCSRASARDKLFLPLPRGLEPGDRRIQNALGERARLASIGKYDTPVPIGPAGEYGTTLHMIAQSVGEGTFTPLHKRFEGPDLVFGK
jgi:hypothetical protein